MEFKGTKGPWFISEIGEPISGNYNCGSHKVHPSIDVWFSDVHDVKSNEEAHANAKLISKAPEMLEMLERLKLMCDNLVMPTERDLNVYSIEISNLIKEATEL